MNSENILAGLVRIGTVTVTEGTKCRVKYQGTDMTSGWLHVLQRSGGGVSVAPDGGHGHSVVDTYTGGGSANPVPNHSHPGTMTGAWMPKVNDTVLVLYLSVEQGDGFVLGGI